jgi:hypothetical protein
VNRQLPDILGEAKLQALCTLSNMPVPLTMRDLLAAVEQAPDPETAVRGVLHAVTLSSATLERKWRSTITDLWALRHPQVPTLPELPLSAEDVENSVALADATAFLNELERHPAHLVRERGEWLLEPTEVLRFAGQLPSLHESPLYQVEHEWGSPAVRRLRALLVAARLARPLKGRLLPIHSRVAKWRLLPPTQQFYLLWHADAYHVPWAEFGGLWSAYVRVMQEYLPLLWEAIGKVAPGTREQRSHFSGLVLETFAPLWEEEGLLEAQRGDSFALQMVQHHALPTIVDRCLVRDLLQRHGLVTLDEDISSAPTFTWTTTAAALIPAEASQQLPCGNDLLRS